ncbi:MAG: adenylosuccinate synthase [Methanomassiliicoccaceae archaeon]|nr:adenylosuccinate synthase [Methanomassiliicoccaceae archaeon]
MHAERLTPTNLKYPYVLNRIGVQLPSIAIIGAQWGDEGKGKITDYLSEEADIIVRSQGGNNAGHTIIIDNETFKLHLLPSGILREGKLAVIGNGVVMSMADMIEEMKQITDTGRSLDGLRISDRAHLVLGYHKRLDGGEEIYRGSKTIGTTKKGIGPAYQDKAARNGFRVCDLFDDVSEKIAFNLRFKKDLLKLFQNGECGCTEESIAEKFKLWKDVFGKYVCDTSVLLNEALDDGKTLLFEGAQGVMLDIDHGTYPYVTSSNTTAGGICTGSGIAPNRIGKVYGCLKAYTTRVGDGPMVTELHGTEGKYLMEKGGEYGVTTGRGRRCGWLDLVVAEHSVRLCGIASLALTKLDVLNGYRKINVCVGYEIDGRTEKHFPASLSKVSRASPVYKEFDGWDEFGPSEEAAKRGYDALPKNMRAYIEFIEKYLKVPAELISIGPKRSETIDKRAERM